MKTLAERCEDIAKRNGDPEIAQLAVNIRNRIAERELGHPLELPCIGSTFWQDVNKANHEKRQYSMGALGGD